MKFCVPFAFNPTEQWSALARAAEDAGFEAIVLSDHLFYPERLDTPYPYTKDGVPLWERSTPWPDPLVATGALGAVTERIRFLTAVYLLPLRHPVMAAKQIASASVFCGGRLTLGVGCGWMRQEFDVVGRPFDRRGARMLEGVEVMQKLWRGGVVEHHGEFYDFEPLEISPVPDAPIPIWGGGTADVALRRAATCMSGWVSQIQTRAEMREYVAKMRAWRADSPLADQPLEVCAAVKDAYQLDHFREMGELGVTHLTFVPWLLYGVTDDDVQKKCDALRRFGDEVIARL